MSTIAKTEQDKFKHVRELIVSQEKELQKGLPAHLKNEEVKQRLLRIVYTEFRKTPKLLECNTKSIIGSIMQAFQLGLEIGGALGHAYLVPFKGQCQFIIGYRGMIDLARRSNEILSIAAHVVHKQDKFEFEYGLNEKLVHIPLNKKNEKGEIVPKDDDDIVAFYAVVKLANGGAQFEVMYKADVEKIRAKSPASNHGPWIAHYAEMGRKTVIRRLFKYLPVSVELSRAVMLDELAESGLQDNESFYEGEFEQVFDNNEAIEEGNEE